MLKYKVEEREKVDGESVKGLGSDPAIWTCFIRGEIALRKAQGCPPRLRDPGTLLQVPTQSPRCQHLLSHLFAMLSHNGIRYIYNIKTYIFL